jgi:hypothetical protein
MRALTLVADRQLVVADVPAPSPPGASKVQMLPVIATEVPIDDIATALRRMESRQGFGKIIVYF